MAYLDHGPYNFPGFLVELLSIPAGVQALELGGQAVMLPHKEGVHGRELRHLTGAGVPWREQESWSLPEQMGSTETAQPAKAGTSLHAPVLPSTLHPGLHLAVPWAASLPQALIRVSLCQDTAGQVLAP